MSNPSSFRPHLAPFQGAVTPPFLPEVYATLRPPATFAQPSGLLRQIPFMQGVLFSIQPQPEGLKIVATGRKRGVEGDWHSEAAWVSQSGAGHFQRLEEAIY